MGNAICPVEHNSVCAYTKTHRSDGIEAFDGAGKLMSTFVQNAHGLDFRPDLNPDYGVHYATPIESSFQGADTAYFE